MAWDSQQLAVIIIMVKTGVNNKAMLAQYDFALSVNHNALNFVSD